MLVMEVMVPRQLELSCIVGMLIVEVGLVCLKSQWVHVRRSVLPGRVPMPWPRPSGAGLPAQRQGPWRGVPAQ
jgi:hypothetical protein